MTTPVIEMMLSRQKSLTRFALNDGWSNSQIRREVTLPCWITGSSSGAAEARADHAVVGRQTGARTRVERQIGPQQAEAAQFDEIATRDRRHSNFQDAWQADKLTVKPVRGRGAGRAA
jgi:hypothetical protein